MLVVQYPELLVLVLTNLKVFVFADEIVEMVDSVLFVLRFKTDFSLSFLTEGVTGREDPHSLDTEPLADLLITLLQTFMKRFLIELILEFIVVDRLFVLVFSVCFVCLKVDDENIELKFCYL